MEVVLQDKSLISMDNRRLIALKMRQAIQHTTVWIPVILRSARHPKFAGRLTTNTEGRSIKPKEEGHQKACQLGAEAFTAKQLRLR